MLKVRKIISEHHNNFVGYFFFDNIFIYQDVGKRHAPRFLSEGDRIVLSGIKSSIFCKSDFPMCGNFFFFGKFKI